MRERKVGKDGDGERGVTKAFDWAEMRRLYFEAGKRVSEGPWVS